VESTVNATAVIDWVLSEKVFLSVEELMALLLEVRKYFKEATTTKCLLALPAAGAHTVSTFSVGANYDLLDAAPTLPLRTLNIILNGSTSVTGILDSGARLVIIHQDVLERLGPL